jgi:predicted ArsR family transcriptional regulator
MPTFLSSLFSHSILEKIGEVGQAFSRALDAVADPIRMRIVRHLAARGPASIAELARAAGVHANTARAHLSALERAAVVLREPEAPRGRGRPALRFRLREDAPPPGADLRALAELLAAAVGRPRGPRLARLRELGTGWGHRVRPRAAGERDPAHELAEGLSRLGFRARLSGNQVELSACPCPLISPDHPEIVCTLAQGAAAGLVAHAGLNVRSASHEPAHQRCVLVLG